MLGGCATGMKQGLFRLSLQGIGEVARVHPSAGDAGPFLDRESYELLDFTPAFDLLPGREEYRRHTPLDHWMENRCEDSWSEAVQL